MTLEFTIARQEFFSGLALLQNIAGKKGTIAILNNVLITTKDNSIEMVATDLEIGMRTSVTATIISPGAITLPARKLFEIVRELAGMEIHLHERDRHWIQIKSGSSLYNLAGMPSEEFPSFPDYEDIELSELRSETMRELINKTAFSIAQTGETRFTLTGSLMESEKRDGHNYLRMVSSDSHRLSFIEKHIDDTIEYMQSVDSVIIPRKGISEIGKLCDDDGIIKFGFDGQKTVFYKNDTLLVIRLMTGEFPNYKDIIPSVSREIAIKIDRVSFLDSLKRTILFSEDQFNIINIFIEKNKLTLSSQSADIGDAKDEIDIEYEGQNMRLCFNCKFFIDVLQVMKADIINIYISSEDSPCLIDSEEDEGFISIIMPMKL